MNGQMVSNKLAQHLGMLSGHEMMWYQVIQHWWECMQPPCPIPPLPCPAPPRPFCPKKPGASYPRILDDYIGWWDPRILDDYIGWWDPRILDDYIGWWDPRILDDYIGWFPSPVIFRPGVKGIVHVSISWLLTNGYYYRSFCQFPNRQHCFVSSGMSGFQGKPFLSVGWKDNCPHRYRTKGGGGSKGL